MGGAWGRAQQGEGLSRTDGGPQTVLGGECGGDAVSDVVITTAGARRGQVGAARARRTLCKGRDRPSTAPRP